MVVGECFVRFEHCELWVVSGRDSFIAEYATNFKDALHAADDQSLEVQLERDAQEQLHVERVVMSYEWSSVGTTSLDMQHGGFDFYIAATPKSGAHAGNDGVANFERAAGIGIDDEVGIALAKTRVDIRQAVPFVGHWAQ